MLQDLLLILKIIKRTCVAHKKRKVSSDKAVRHSVIYFNNGVIMQDLQKMIQEAVKNSGADESISTELANKLEKELSDFVTLNSLKAKLSVLFEYEKNYLELVKEFKEEIKFASGIQEDLRKERAKFFSETLKEVSSTLTESQVENKVASQWLKELVDSYTKSLDLSGGLIEEHTLDMIGTIRDKAKSQKNSVEISNQKSDA